MTENLERNEFLASIEVVYFYRTALYKLLVLWKAMWYLNALESKQHMAHLRSISLFYVHIQLLFMGAGILFLNSNLTKLNV